MKGIYFKDGYNELNLTFDKGELLVIVGVKGDADKRELIMLNKEDIEILRNWLNEC